jgi:hypothetical protein
MKPKLCDIKVLCINSVNHTMLIRDTARPEPSKGVLQRFRFPDPLKMAPHSVLDQFVDSSDHFLVLRYFQWEAGILSLPAVK